MHTQLGNKIATLLKNHAELTDLIQSIQFKQFDADTQLSLLNLHEEVDTIMNSLNAQIDALDLRIADMLCSLNL